MKRIILSIFILVSCSFLLTACGDEKNEAEEKQQEVEIAESVSEEAVKDTETVTSAFGNLGVNDSYEEPAEEDIISETEEVIQEESESNSSLPSDEVNDETWGTKRPVSAVIERSGSEYEGVYEVNDDGSYTLRVQNGIRDNLYYFAKTGKLTRQEVYQFSQDNQDGELIATYYYLFGLPLTDIRDYDGPFFPFIWNSVQFTNVMKLLVPDYDEYGEISADDGYIRYIVNDEELNQEVEKDDQGRLSKIVYDNNPKTPDDDPDKSYGILSFTYEDNKIIMGSYTSKPNYYDATARTTGVEQWNGDAIIQQNSKGFPSSMSISSPHYNDGEIYPVGYCRYDKYGNFSALYNGYDNLMVSIINKYEDGTETSPE